MSLNNQQKLFLLGAAPVLPPEPQAAETGRSSATNPPTTQLTKRAAPQTIPGLTKRNAKPNLYTRDQAGTIRRDAVLVGRNDACPCGSGKKYKHCCGKPRQVTRIKPPAQRKTSETPADPIVPFREEDAKVIGLPMHDVFVQLLNVFKDDPEHIYAYMETGRIISPASRSACSDEELQDYDAALKRWSDMSPEQHEAERANWASYAQDATTWPHARGSDTPTQS